MANVNIQIVDVGLKGDGVGHFTDDTGDRKTVFVPRTLSGESIVAQVKKGKDGDLRGVVSDITEQSPHRVDPPCQHYSQCGGCQMQHVSDDFYKEWKLQQVTQILQSRLDQDIPEITPHFVSAQTRRRASFSCVKTKGKVSVGFNAARSNYVVDVTSCLLLDPVLSKLHGQLGAIIEPILPDGKVIDVFVQNVGGSVDLVITGPLSRDKKAERARDMMCADLLSQTDVQRISWRLKDRHTPELWMQADSIHKTMGKYRVNLSPQAFLQPSVEGEKLLVQGVLSAVEQTKGQKIADLFAGYGTFTGALAQQGYAVDAFEVDDLAMSTLVKSGHGQSFARDLFHLPLRKDELKKYDCIVLDPPRAGAKEQIRIVADSKVDHIVYVSCNPVSCAKDLKVLEEHGFEIMTCQLVDQFAWSTHAELIIRLRRKV